MKILLTGGSGRIGSELIPILLSSGHTIVSLSRRTIGNHHPNFKSIQCDLSSLSFENGKFIYKRDEDVEHSLLDNISKIDCILHLAGLPSGEGFTPEDYLKQNLYPTQTLVEIAKYFNIPKFIFSSTASVYGESKSLEPSIETDSLNGKSFYAVSKIESEKYILQSSIPNIVIFRISSVYGKNLKSYINKIIKYHNKSIFPYPLKKNLYKSFIYIEDLLNFIMSGLLYEGRGIFNLSHPQKVSSEMLFKTLSNYYPKFVLKIFIPEILVSIEENFWKWSVFKKKESLLKPLFHKSLIDSTKAIQKLNYTPKIDIQTGIQLLLIPKTIENK
jgi:UDP-glucose 4-epimerase